MRRGAPGARAAPPPRVRTGTSGRTGTPRHAGTSCRARSVRGGARLTWVGRCGSGMWRSQSPRRVPCEGVRTLYRSGSFMIGGWGECARRESCEERVIGGLACRCGRDAACASGAPQRTHLGRSALSPTPAPPAAGGPAARALRARPTLSASESMNEDLASTKASTPITANTRNTAHRISPQPVRSPSAFFRDLFLGHRWRILGKKKRFSRAPRQTLPRPGARATAAV